MTPGVIAVLCVIGAAWIAVGAILGAEQLRTLRRQCDLDEHYADVCDFHGGAS